MKNLDLKEMENLLHSLPDGSSKWRPTSQPVKVDPEDFCPDPEDLSFDSSCDSINEENVFINNISTMALESTIIQRSLCIQRNIRGQKALNVLRSFLQLVLFKAKVVQIQLVELQVFQMRKKSASLKIYKFFLELVENKRKKILENRILRIRENIACRKIGKNIKEFIEKRKNRMEIVKKKIAGRKILKNIKKMIERRKNLVQIIRNKIAVRKIVRFLRRIIEKRVFLLNEIRRKVAARVILRYLKIYREKRRNNLKKIKDNIAARKIVKFIQNFLKKRESILAQIRRNICARKIFKFLRNVSMNRNIRLGQIRRKIASRKILNFLRNCLKIKKIALSKIKEKICARKILRCFKLFKKHRDLKLTQIKQKISSRKILKFLQKSLNQRKSILHSLKQKISCRKILNFLKKLLENRKLKLLKLKQNLYSRKFLKNLRFSLNLRKSSLLKLRQNISARKITNLFKLFLSHKKAFSSNLLEKFRYHCAVLIQKHFRGYLIRKSFKSLLKARESRLKSLLLGWKTRRVLKSSEISFFKLRARHDSSFRLEFIQKTYNLIEGPWVVKAKLPPHRRILYKNSTKQLRVSHERKLSSQSLDDSVQKEKEIKKQVKFSLKHHESPKLNEPDLKANPKKSILRSKGNNQIVDWENFQEKLDRVFFESEGRLSFDESGLEGSKGRNLLFRNRPRMKKKQKRLEMKEWNVDDFEVACEEDTRDVRSFKFLDEGKVPVLNEGSRFWKEIEVNSLYISLKKEYNFLKSGSSA